MFRAAPRLQTETNPSRRCGGVDLRARKRGIAAVLGANGAAN